MAWLLGGALIFGTVFKIQQAFREAIKTIVDFRQAIIDVGAITEATGEEMVVLEKAARDVATSTKMGFMEAAEALKILGQAGMTAMQSAQALKTVAMLTTATGASTQEAVKVLTTAINVWNMSAKESTASVTSSPPPSILQIGDRGPGHVL
jgi:TP901 family phage tail tape measure protein